MTGLGASPKAQQLLSRLRTFMKDHVDPVDHVLEAFHGDRLNPDRCPLPPLEHKAPLYKTLYFCAVEAISVFKLDCKPTEPPSKHPLHFGACSHKKELSCIFKAQSDLDMAARRANFVVKP